MSGILLRIDHCHTILRSSFHHHIDRIWQVLQWKYLLIYLLYCVVSYLLHCVSETAVIVAKINTNISSHHYICRTLHITEYYTLDICLKTYQILSLSSKCDNWLIFYSIKLIAMVFSSYLWYKIWFAYITLKKVFIKHDSSRLVTDKESLLYHQHVVYKLPVYWLFICLSIRDITPHHLLRVLYWSITLY